MNERHFAYKLRQHLDRGLRDVSPGTLARLHAARQAALARQKQPADRPVLAADGPSFPPGFRNHCFNQTLAAIVLLLSALCSTLWIADQRVKELGSIDSAILSDELPIGAFTDEGFAAWLDDASRAE
jgi:hypothetical protein